MDALLKLAADAGVEVSAAEAALEQAEAGEAREALDRADDALAALAAAHARGENDEFVAPTVIGADGDAGVPVRDGD
ncbi:MAG TPA: hypothetical protein VF250_09070, partial [Conexibacter sp.]